MTVTTSGNGNAGVGLGASSYALLGVMCTKGLNDSSGVICIPYVYSTGGGTLGFHAMSEREPFGAVASRELEVDVFYRRL